MRENWHYSQGFESQSRTQMLLGKLSVESSFGLAITRTNSRQTEAVTGFGFLFSLTDEKNG